MIIDRQGADFEAGGKLFTIGGEVWVNEKSDWCGLHGYVTEIHTGDDKDTWNETADLYCNFDASDSGKLAAEIEERFSRLYQTEKKLDDLPMGGVVMAPDMLEPVCPALPDTDRTLMTLTCWSEKDKEGGMEPETLGVSASKDYLLRLMSDDVVSKGVEVVLERTVFYEDCMEFSYSTRDYEPSDALLCYAIAPAPLYAGKEAA